MTQHHHKHPASHKHEHIDPEEWSAKRLHKDWRVWLTVGVMLIAIVVYVLSLDDSILPAIMQR
jgi:ABC-type nickel/cobalt efflux system permease component RcnA